jgi:hypothetical protein
MCHSVCGPGFVGWFVASSKQARHTDSQAQPSASCNGLDGLLAGMERHGCGMPGTLYMPSTGIQAEYISMVGVNDSGSKCSARQLHTRACRPEAGLQGVLLLPDPTCVLRRWVGPQLVAAW